MGCRIPRRSGAKAPIQLARGNILAAATVRLSPSGAAIECHGSRNLGQTWELRGEIVRDPTTKVDLGDGTFLQRRNGELLFVYRHNFDDYFDRDLADKDHVYRIEVAISRDEGRTWQPHSTVTSVKGTRMGLWSPSLFERSDGALQCYHDDEHAAEQSGYRLHDMRNIIDDDHPLLFPGVCELKSPTDEPTVLVRDAQDQTRPAQTEAPFHDPGGS